MLATLNLLLLAVHDTFNRPAAYNCIKTSVPRLSRMIAKHWGSFAKRPTSLAIFSRTGLPHDKQQKMSPSPHSLWVCIDHAGTYPSPQDFKSSTMCLTAPRSRRSFGILIEFCRTTTYIHAKIETSASTQAHIALRLYLKVW